MKKKKWHNCRGALNKCGFYVKDFIIAMKHMKMGMFIAVY